MDALAGRWATRFVTVYRVFLSPFLAPRCRFYPSCSAYAVEALETRGFVGGMWLTARRLFRCAPWHPGGYDPVPPVSRPLTR